MIFDLVILLSVAERFYVSLRCQQGVQCSSQSREDGSWSRLVKVADCHCDKRARTVAPRDPAECNRLATGCDIDLALSQLRARHRHLIRNAIKSQSILLVSYNGKAPSMMRPTSWINEPHMFWTRYIGDNSKESETSYSLSVVKIDDIISFDCFFFRFVT